MKLGVIGIGNIGNAIIKGLSDFSKDYSLVGFDKNSKINNNTVRLNNRFKIENSCQKVIEHSDIIFLCVRTEQVLSWIDEYKHLLNQKTLVLIQSGIKLCSVMEQLGFERLEVMRIITNINISENKGNTIILNSKNHNLNNVKKVFSILGQVIVVENEEELDRMSLITGCTPAIVGMFLTGLLETHNNVNIKRKDLTKLLSDVMINSLKVIENQIINPSDYVKQVYSKGGKFEQCIINLQQDKKFQKNIADWLNPLKTTLEQ